MHVVRLYQSIVHSWHFLTSLALATGLYFGRTICSAMCFVAQAPWLCPDPVRFYLARDATLTIVGLELTRG